MVPYDTMIVYPDESVDEYIIEPTFVKIMELLNVNLDVQRIVETLTRYRSGKSAIEVHYSLDSFDEYIILDTYLGETDQLDFIYIMFRSKDSKGGELRELAHKFYTDTCEYNVYYKEGNSVIENSIKIDFTKPGKLCSKDVIKVIEDKKVILFRDAKIFKEYKNKI